MSIGNSRVMTGAVKPRFNRVVIGTLCILGILPLFNQAAGAAQQNLQANESARLTRLTEIAKSLNDARSDAVSLTTEAARLCGFSLWKEDRTRISDPTGSPALHLAVTDTEIREYTQMFRSGHSVVLGDLIGAMDVLFKRIGGQGSVGPDVMTWLQTGVDSENASVQALTAFLQDLGAFRPGAGFGNFSADTERLDPIQSLFILRVLTEDMAVPLRRALAKMKPGPSLAGPFVTADNRRLERAAPDGAEDASAGGLPTSLDLPLTPCPEAPGYGEDAYVAGITGLFNKVAEGKKVIGKYADGVDNANAILTVVKFIATYIFLDGEMRVEAPGQPLVRTKNTRPGAGTRTVVAHFFINGSRVTDWLKDHRCLVALAGLDLDMPQTGDLKGVRTEWTVDQSKDPKRQLIQPIDYQGSLYNVKTNDKGEAQVTFTGNRQEKDLDPSQVMPIEKTVKITVTPQVKAVEMKQDLVDAVTGAIGIKGGGVGFVTPLMETLYRMAWTGEIHLDLRVRDWQKAETMGQLTVEIKEIGREFRSGYALQMSLDRSLALENAEMDVSGGEMPEAIDPEVLKNLPAGQRALMQEQMEAYNKLMKEAAKKRFFVSIAEPEKVRMSINDRKSVSETYTYSDSEKYAELSEREIWTGSFNSDIPTLPKTSLNSYKFSVEIDLEKKTATVCVQANMVVKNIQDKQRVNFPTHDNPHPKKGEKTHRTGEPGMSIFRDLKLQAPFSGQTPGSEEIKFVLPLKEEPVIDGEGAMNYYGAIPIPFTFGRYLSTRQFKGTAMLSYSVTRKPIKSK